jgi:DNA-binding response OmpR family regulator
VSQRILVIEDDEFQLSLLSASLSDEGYEVFLTSDGPKGIEIYKQKTPDLVLLDLALPSMSGLEVMRKLKELDAAANILVVSGFPSRESIEVAARYGVDEFITKPYLMPELIQRIGAAIRKGGGGGVRVWHEGKTR